MLNTMPMGTNPFDFILGGGAAAVSPGTETGEFSRLLNLLPMKVANDGDATFFDIAGNRQVAIPGSEESGSLGMIPLQLPLALAMSLGIETGPNLEATELPEGSTGKPDSTVISGELIWGKDGASEALFLKVKSNMAEPNGGASIQDDGTILIPVELRTVEQNGNRVIADGFLHQAAGKELPIRVRLELAGSAPGIAVAGSSAEPLSLAGRMPQGVPTPETLPRMLRNLGVNLMVVETSQELAPANPALFLPGSASMSLHRAMTNMARTETTAEPISTTMTNVGQIGTVDGDFGAETANSQDGSSEPALSKENGGISRLNLRMASDPQFGLTGGPSVGQTDAPKTDQPTPVRFFDLDQRLGQLKRAPGQTIRIQLVPAQLGKMELAIAHNRGLVTVNLAVESEQARQAVEANLSQLENHLTSSGIRVDQFQVSVNQPNRQAFIALSEQAYRGQFGQRQNQQQWQGNDPRQARRFAPPDLGFETVMINCLA